MLAETAVGSMGMEEAVAVKETKMVRADDAAKQQLQSAASRTDMEAAILASKAKAVPF